MIERDINKRWEQGIPHHPKSVALMNLIISLDWELLDGYFDFKVGGDGDNGETFMYMLDVHFETEDQNNVK